MIIAGFHEATNSVARVEINPDELRPIVEVVVSEVLHAVDAAPTVRRAVLQLRRGRGHWSQCPVITAIFLDDGRQREGNR